MFVLGNLPRVAWHGKEKGRSQMIGWNPQNGSGDSFPSAEIDTKKSYLLDRVRGRRNQSQYSG